MRMRFLLPVLLCGPAVSLTGCADDAPVVPGDGSSTGGSTGTSGGPEPTGGTVDDTASEGSSSAGESSSGSDTGPDDTGPMPGCGDGIVSDDETCDDENTADGDGCSATCTVEEGWQCDDQPSACVVVCGDAILTGEEECDDDNANDGDGCSAACTLENGWACEGTPSDCETVCGDGFVVGESCDDGNTDPGDGCSDNCLPESGWTCSGEPSVCNAVCGDGNVLGGEQCDDEDLEPGDGCDAACMVELGWSCMGSPSTCITGCGDGIIVGSEQCDDLGVVDGDGCSAACELEPGWVCNNEPSACATVCGDGILAGSEQCDDGGLAAADGCDAACMVESGWVCAGEPSACITDCGDGVMVGAEACDDGNIEAGDGCRFTCDVEFGWSCAGSPSACTITESVATFSLGDAGGCVLTTLGELGCFGANAESDVGNGTDGVQVDTPVFVLDDVVASTSGEDFHCAIRANGSVWCWGDNIEEQIGPQAVDGVDVATPLEVTGLPPVVELQAGDDFACAIDAAGQVWCWGDNDNRQLGQGGTSTIDSPTPVAVALPGGLAAIDLGLGQDNVCVVLEDNTVACWGDDDNGQLGDGTSGTDNGVATLVPGLAVINDVEGGEDTMCALDDLGQLWCWGDNVDGQLGIGSTLDNDMPQLVALPLAAQAIALGDQYSCAVLVTDEVYCWGEANDFQLASGDLVSLLVPAPVMGLPAMDVVHIAAGGRGMCVLSGAGERWCWGYSEDGQLGLAPQFQLEPGSVSFSGPVVDVELDAAEYRGVMCGVLADGTAECAGSGTLVSSSVDTPAAGYFEPVSYHLTEPTTLPLVSGVQALGMGDAFICVATAIDVQCWGDNTSRQLGQGGTSTTDILTPVPVMGLGAVDELEVGTRFACVRVGGTVQCWGENGNSQTGNGGTTTDQSLPVTVQQLADAVDVAVGEGHACALRATGVVSCWGDDAVGQLGDNDMDTTDSAIPVDVTGLPAGGATQIVTGQDHTCALASGEVYCWGEGQYGQLGQGNEGDSDTALLVPGVAGIVQIASGYNYVCALDGAGDMWCWGYSLDGQLGNGGELVTGLDETLSPTPFFVASGITSVVAGNSMTCIETVAGWSCLGFRGPGQLGNGTTVTPALPTPTPFGL
jgi:cysteine-rich repeat protein